MIRKVTNLLFKASGMAILVIGLVYAIWQPVFPSGILVKAMVDTIDPKAVSLDRPVVVRFDLSGKGGGVFSVRVDHTSVEMIKGKTDAVDLIIFMKATDFNDMIAAMSKGKGDPTLITRLMISNIFSFAGDMNLFGKIFNQGAS
jgi:hypothetical protein